MFNSSVNIFLYSLVKERPLYTIILLALSLISTFCNVVGSILLISILLILIGNYHSLILPSFLLKINSLSDNFNSPSRVANIILLLIIIVLIKNVVSYISSIVSFKYIKYLTYEMKIKGFKILCKVDFDYYLKNKREEIFSKLNREIEQAAFAVKSIQQLLIISITIAILTVALIIISWQLTFVSYVILGCLFLINNWLSSQVHQARITSTQSTQAANRQIIQFLAGIRSIKTAANEAKEFKAIAESIRAKDREQFRTQLISASIKPITEIGGVLLVLTLTIVAYYLYPQAISIIAPIFLVYLIILLRLLPFISQFRNTRQQYINTRSSIEVVANFLAPANKPISHSGDLKLNRLKTGIEFKAVTFAYPQHAQIVLDKISFSVPQGQKTALVGFPGTSNSIIADLLTRFYEPIEGSIFLDNQKLSKYNTSSLRKAIAIVSRETFIFNRSLAANIAYGIDHASESDIIAAAKKAQIYEFIEQLPAGLATKVGERGIRLSELQKQKISFARACLRNPEIVILDEPFDFLGDNLINLESTKEIIHALCHNCTSVIITKQLNLAKTAEQIVLFSKGKIVEIGTHQQLLQHGNLYQRLYSMQFKNNQESRQLKLAHKIAQKLTQQNKQNKQNNSNLSEEIRLNLDVLLNYLELLGQDTLKDKPQQEIILDESFHSAKNILASIKEYERKLSQEITDY